MFEYLFIFFFFLAFFAMKNGRYVYLFLQKLRNSFFYLVKEFERTFDVRYWCYVALHVLGLNFKSLKQL
jgi:hypothetical protein